MKRFLLSLGALYLVFWATAVSVALAQVNTVPQVGLITSTLRQNTYSAVSIGLVPASSATDIFCLSGSSTRGIGITQLVVTGIATTAVSTPITLVHRASLDTGGTAALTTAAPNLTVGPLLSSSPAATATLIAYTANPTIVDTSPTYGRTQYLNIPLATTAAIVPLNWTFGPTNGLFNHSAAIPSGRTAEQWCVNLNAVTVSGGVLNVFIEWVEG